MTRRRHVPPRIGRLPRPTGRQVHVAFVGTGPGDPSLLTVGAAGALKHAHVVAAGEGAGQTAIHAYVSEDAEIVDLGAQVGAEVGQRLVELVEGADGGLVVRLIEGDPGLFPGLVAECAALQAAGHGFAVYPGVPVRSAVPLYAGIPLSSQESPNVHFIDAGSQYDLAGSEAPDVTVVLTGTPKQLVGLVGQLLDAGRARTTPVAVTHHGTTHEQATVTGTLADAAGVLGAVTCDRAVLVAGSSVEHRAEVSWFETKPLFGWKVLVPRTAAQAKATVSRLEDYGALSQVVPTIAIEPPRLPQLVDKAITGLVAGRYEWVGFTSANAVRAVREKFAEYGLDTRSLAGVKIAAVGGVTAKALTDWGIHPDLVPTGEQSAAGLLADWPPYDDELDPIDRVLLPRADIATDKLVAGLTELGWQVDDVTAYRTVRAAPPPPDVREAIKTGEFDAVLFTSSSTVRNLVGIAGKPHKITVVACIGEATAATAREHGLNVEIVAPQTNSAALIDALADWAVERGRSAYDAGEPILPPRAKRRRRSKPVEAAAEAGSTQAGPAEAGLAGASPDDDAEPAVGVDSVEPSSAVRADATDTDGELAGQVTR